MLVAASTGTVYKGLALSANGTDSLLYAADFHNAKIDVFDGAFTAPDIPAGFAPFGIQAINGSIYVAYAMQNAHRQNDVPGAGLGFVDVLDSNGLLVKSLIAQGNLNALWGMTLAPASFGDADGRLAGNFGDGSINAYDLATGSLIGHLVDVNGSPILFVADREFKVVGNKLGNPLNYLPSPTQFTSLVSFCFHKLNEDFVPFYGKNFHAQAGHVPLLFTVIVHIRYKLSCELLMR